MMNTSTALEAQLAAEVQQLRRRVAELEQTLAGHTASEHELRERKQIFRTAFEQSPVGIACVEVSGHWLLVNDRFCAITGYSRAELMARSFQDIAHPDDHTVDRANIAQLLAGEVCSYEMEQRYRHKDGGTVWVSLSVALVRAPDGSPRYFIAQVQDVTARKRVEQEHVTALVREQAARAAAEAAGARLQRLQQVTDAALSHLALDELLHELVNRIAALFEVDTVAVLLLDESRHDLVVRAALGLELEGEVRIAVGQGFAGRIAAARQPMVLIGGDLAGSVSAALQAQHLHSLLGVPLLVNGRLLGVLHVGSFQLRQFDADEIYLLQLLSDRAALAIDHARLYAAAQEATRSKDEALALLNTLITSAPIGFAFLDHELRYRIVNDRMAEINGLPAWAYLDRTIYEVAPGLAPVSEPRLHQVLATGQPNFELELSVEIPDAPGQRRSWLVSHYPVRAASARVVGVGIVVVEITERKRAADEVQAARERLQTLSQYLLNAQERERRQIAHELHDEIGQALTALKINLHMLRVQDETPHMTESIAIVDRLLEQVRTLSLDLRPSVLDDLGLAAALEWYVDRLSQRTGLATEVIDEMGERALPQAIATACFRVAQEALTNIVRHAQARRVSVTIAVQGAELLLTVCDDGIGFDVAAALARARHGSSLGLISMAERAEMAGGRLEMDSGSRRGTLVRVWFPLTDEVRTGAPS